MRSGVASEVVAQVKKWIVTDLLPTLILGAAILFGVYLMLRAGR